MSQRVSLEQFSLQELSQLRQGFEGEVNALTQSMSQFRFAMDKYEEGKRAIKAAQEVSPTDEMLIPLSNALYIEGRLDNLRNNERMYLIEYGAGFFVERNAKEATQFYQRKIALIRERTVKLQEILAEKKDGLRQLEIRMMMLMQQQKDAEKPK